MTPKDEKRDTGDPHSVAKMLSVAIDAHPHLSPPSTWVLSIVLNGHSLQRQERTSPLPRVRDVGERAQGRNFLISDVHQSLEKTNLGFHWRPLKSRGRREVLGEPSQGSGPGKLDSGALIEARQAPGWAQPQGQSPRPQQQQQLRQ